MRPVQPRSPSGSPDQERGAPGGKRALYALLSAAGLIALLAFGLAQLVGWGTPVPQPVIPEPPAGPQPFSG